MKVICKYASGSAAYGLLTSQSDKDESFIFLHTEISKIIGLDKHLYENKLDRATGLDSQGYELRHFLNLMRKGNSQMLELINNDKWLEKSAEFDLIQSKKRDLFDSATIYKCFRAYSYSERQLIFGRNNTGVLGEKRKKAIIDFGYSFRNASHAFRLIRAAVIFFTEDYFPVNIVEKDKEFGALIKDIKVNPQNHDPKKIEQDLINLEKDLDSAYNNRRITYKYNENVANRLCYDLYMSILIEKGKENARK